ncbi:MAG: hypothetical protein HS126_31265 [Anaerolineales bacterium]|nr:hypothetical protein [Anaerolineales bacterium]
MAIQQSSLNDVFRFMKVRVPNIESEIVKLLNTQFASIIQDARSTDARRVIADEILANNRREIARSVDDLTFGQAVNTAMQNSLEIEDATLQNIFDFLDDANSMIRAKNSAEVLISFGRKAQNR